MPWPMAQCHAPTTRCPVAECARWLDASGAGRGRYDNRVLQSLTIWSRGSRGGWGRDSRGSAIFVRSHPLSRLSEGLTINGSEPGSYGEGSPIWARGAALLGHATVSSGGFLEVSYYHYLT